MMTLMPTPDELALKQQVTDTLVREGVLAKIKVSPMNLASIRACLCN